MKLEFQESQGEYILDVFRINDENGIESIRECIEHYNDNVFNLTFMRKFDAYFIIYNDSDENDSYNQHITLIKHLKRRNV